VVEAMLVLQELVGRFTYAGVLVTLLLGSLGLPIPEEMPIIAAGILADVHRVERWLALAALIGLTGGVVVLVMRSNRRVSKAP
jgi:membrane protein DedA with SNARE-associated domain